MSPTEGRAASVTQAPSAGHLPPSPVARRATLGVIAAFVFSAAALAWLHRGGAAPDPSSLPVAMALAPAVVAYLVTGLYCVYLGIGALRARRFPAPMAHLPTSTTIRSGAAGLCAGAAMLLAALGLGYLAWLAIGLTGTA